MLVDGELACTLEHDINERTGRRIRALRVEASPERIAVSGIAPSYYLKQLVWVVVENTLGAGRAPQVVLDIDVCGTPPRAAEGRDRVYMND